MKPRSNHIGGWRWRLRVKPWGTYIAASAFITLFVTALVLTLYLLNRESAS